MDANDHQTDYTALEQLRRETAAAAAAFLPAHEVEIEQYRAAIGDAIGGALAELGQTVESLSAANPVARRLAELLADYAGWMQWALWDLPYFAVALRPPLEQFRPAVAGCGLVYLSIRLFDDAIDRHFWYKGHHPTLLESNSQSLPDSRAAEALSILGGLLLCFEGLHRLASPDQPAVKEMLLPVVEAVRGAVVGATMELSGDDSWSPAFYDRLVQLKNVDYWRSLYSALDPGRRSPLYPFLERYYELAQNLNDVQDFAEDQRRGQPNLLSIYLGQGNGRPGAPRPLPPLDGAGRMAPPDVEGLLAGKLLRLGEMSGDLPEPEASIARLKLSETLTSAYALGLFAPPAPEKELFPPNPMPPRLYWYSTLEEVVELAGPGSLEEVDCPVCAADGRRFLFRKQGFAYYRCFDCGHIYVSPRVTAAVQELLLQDLDGLSFEDRYLEVQRLYAESICHRLRLRTPGARLLDIGFGRGYLLQLAQAYGFEVHGIDSSLTQVERLRPTFGQRLLRMVIGQQPIPWEALDVVVMSHVLEHLPQPAAVLREIWQRMNGGGLLYVAVPDMDSVTYQLFGKKWDVVNPLAHLQYFGEGSLRRLLDQCGFEQIERVHHPQTPEELAPRWMRLLRRFGASDAGELALLANVPQGKAT